MKQNIRTESLAIGYGSNTIVSNLNLQVDEGLLTALSGRNGCGKSTLLRTIAGLLKPMDGAVCIGMRDCKDISQQQMARLVGIVTTGKPEELSLNVTETVALGRTPFTNFWGGMNTDDKITVAEAMAKVGIESLGSKRLCELSDGELQKVMIAKTLAQQTPIILLDEPTAFLDFPAKVELLTMLRQLAHDEGKTILFTTHDISLALQVADRFWLMHDGKIDCGTPEQMKQSDALHNYIGEQAWPFL